MVLDNYTVSKLNAIDDIILGELQRLIHPGGQNL